MNHTVSILMPTRNNAEFIRKAICSTLNQTYKNIEFIIGNDGSSDNTEDIVKEYSDERIVHFCCDSFENPHGTAYMTNRCFEHSTGDIIAFIDSDDWHELDRIEKSVNALLTQDIDIVSCKTYFYIDDKIEEKDSAGMIPHNYIRHIRGNAPVCASRVCWRNVIDIVGPLKEDLKRGSDGYWNIKSLMLGMRWGFIDEFLYYYRFHKKQLTVNYDTKEHKNDILDKWMNGEYILHLLD